MPVWKRATRPSSEAKRAAPSQVSHIAVDVRLNVALGKFVWEKYVKQDLFGRNSARRPPLSPTF
jgi:hypothetical protein